jgi:hypothetical protein
VEFFFLTEFMCGVDAFFQKKVGLDWGNRGALLTLVSWIFFIYDLHA